MPDPSASGVRAPESQGARVDEPLHDDPVEPDVVSSERVYEGRVWDLRRDVVRLADGEITREYVDHSGAVAILALDDDDRVLLIKQYRHPVRTRDWELPAGLLDVDGEAPLDAAKRELAEEVDLEADRWHLLTRFHTSPGGSDELLLVYLARGVRPTSAAFDRVEEEADLETRWVPLDDVVEAVLTRSVANGILALSVLAASAQRAAGWRHLGAPTETSAAETSAAETSAAETSADEASAEG